MFGEKGSMVITEIIAVAFAAIKANAMRSVLTTLGIIIGVGAVISMVSLRLSADPATDRGDGDERPLHQSLTGTRDGGRALRVLPPLRRRRRRLER
jgi:predicted phage tail protein